MQPACCALRADTPAGERADSSAPACRRPPPPPLPCHNTCNIHLVLKHAIQKRRGLLIPQAISARQRFLCTAGVQCVPPPAAARNAARAAPHPTYPSQRLGEAQDCAVGRAVLKVGVVHGVACAGDGGRGGEGVHACNGRQPACSHARWQGDCKRTGVGQGDTHGIAAVLLHSLSQRLKVACGAAPATRM